MALLWYSWIFIVVPQPLYFVCQNFGDKKKGRPEFTSFGFFKSKRSDYAHCLRICLNLSGFVAQNESTPHRLYDEQRKQRRRGVQADSDDENSLPAVFRGNNARERHQQRGSAFAVYNIPLLVVANFAPKVSPLVAGNRLYISPNTPKYAAVARTKTTGMLAISRKRQQHEGRRPERDEHRVLAADGIREPTEERTAETIENTGSSEMAKGQCCHFENPEDSRVRLRS